MEATNASKPRVCFEFQVEKVIGVSSDGNYQVQWAPAWVSKFHLLGCEHLIQEFLRQQLLKEINDANQVEVGDQASDLEYNCCHPSLEMVEPDSNGPLVSQETSNMEASVDTTALSVESDAIVENTSTEGFVESMMSMMGDLMNSKITKIENDGPVNPAFDLEMKSSTLSETDMCQGELELPVSDLRTLDNVTEFSKQTQQPELVALSVSTGITAAHEHTVCVNRSTNTSTSTNNNSTSKIDLENKENSYSTPQSNTSSDSVKNLRRSCRKSKKQFKNIPSSDQVIKMVRSSQKNRMRHQKNEIKYQCPQCGKPFVKLRDLKEHIRVTSHNSQLSCTNCSKVLKCKSDFDIHMRKHTGEKPYTCTSCGKSFSTRGNLKAHIKTLHTGTKPFGCEICRKTFYTKSKRERHMVVHTGKRNFSCESCGKLFRRKDYLNGHFKRCSSTST